MKKLLPIFTILFFALVANRALLVSGLPPTHDGEYHIIRFYQFDKTLRDGQWYPRWQPDLNYGYGSPLLNYYYPLPNYAASFLHFLGASFIDSLKLQMLIASILGAIFMYLWARLFWGEWGGVVASFFYTYSPYHFLDLYIRGSVGEIWSLGLFPAFLWSTTKAFRDKKRIFVYLSSVFLAAIIVSHNILALMFFPLALSYMIFLTYQEKKRKKLLSNILLIIILSLGLTAIFWLPAIFERSYVQGLEIFDYRQHFVEVYQLVFPSWGSGFSADLTTQGLSFQIGIANLIGFGLALFFTLYFRYKYKKSTAINTFFIFATLIAILLMLKFSQPIWDTFPLLRYFQFPWRLLSLVILFCSFLSGSLVFFWPRKVFVFLLVGLAFILGIGYSTPAYYHQRDDNYYITRSNFIDGTNVPGNSFNTIWMNAALKRESEKIKLAKEEGELEIHYVKATGYNFQLNARQDSEILVNTAYFPGWTVFINGREIPIEPNKDGLISFLAPKGKNMIEVKFLNTPIRNLGNMITLTSFILLILLFVKSLRVRIMV